MCIRKYICVCTLSLIYNAHNGAFALIVQYGITIAPWWCGLVFLFWKRLGCFKKKKKKEKHTK